MSKSIEKQACEHLDKVLTALNTYDQNQRKGHNNGREELQKAYSDAEEFLNDIDWESL